MAWLKSGGFKGDTPLGEGHFPWGFDWPLYGGFYLTRGKENRGMVTWLLPSPVTSSRGGSPPLRPPRRRTLLSGWTQAGEGWKLLVFHPSSDIPVASHTYLQGLGSPGSVCGSSVKFSVALTNPLQQSSAALTR